MFDAVLANGEKPPVLSAIMKHECTELGRKATNEGLWLRGWVRAWELVSCRRATVVCGCKC